MKTLVLVPRFLGLLVVSKLDAIGANDLNFTIDTLFTDALNKSVAEANKQDEEEELVDMTLVANETMEEAEEEIREMRELMIQFKICQQDLLIKQFPDQGLQPLTREILLATDSHLLREDDEMFSLAELREDLKDCKKQLEDHKPVVKEKEEVMETNRRRKRSILHFGKYPKARWDSPVYFYGGDLSPRGQGQLRGAVSELRSRLTCLSFVEITAGLAHEQNRADRKTHVTVHLQNIIPDKQHNYAMVNKNKYRDLGVPYSYVSIMHYTDSSFSNGKGKTMTATDGNQQRRMGRGPAKLSRQDVDLLNKAYCNPSPPVECQHPGTREWFPAGSERIWDLSKVKFQMKCGRDGEVEYSGCKVTYNGQWTDRYSPFNCDDIVYMNNKWTFLVSCKEKTTPSGGQLSYGWKGTLRRLTREEALRYWGINAANVCRAL